ncbi:MAG: DUF4386 domain-containing protein [Chitinophagaceae bacterium]|nr:DUF4386 domain-containing protein [Chitinophagaceae bacterium]
METNRNAAKITGLLLLLHFAIGVVINLFILGPLTFTDDNLASISGNAQQLIIAVLLYLISGVMYVSIAIILLPIFKPVNQRLALMFFGFSLISFTIITLDSLGILTLLSISKEYAKGNAVDTNYLKTLGTVFSAVRMWAHLLVILIGCVSLFLFYYLFYRSKRIPGIISVSGLLSVLLMLTAVLIDIFGQGLYMFLFLPAGLVQIAAAVWLMIKGFNKPSVE